ncbi:hypothetical protein F5146DRAFT_1004368 [Armillaria mellea]|nr:hypothetical protein F5146DRAFT_1004368 [Armillaria mellea]
MSDSSSNLSAPQNVSMEVLLQAICTLKLKNQALATENRTLKVTQAAPACSKPASLGPNSSTPSVQSGSSPTALDADDQKILLSVEDVKKLQHCAKKKLLKNWLMFMRNSITLIRWMTTKGRIWEPPSKAESNKRRKEFLSYKSSQLFTTKLARANFIYFGKQSATDIFNDIPIPHTTFNSKYNCVGDELCLHLLGYDKKKERYAQCPEIFYPVGQGGKAHSNIFQAPALVKLLSITLHGQSSLQSNKTMKTTNGDLWEATTISAGAIASAATVMIKSTLTFESTIKTFEYFNQNLFLSKKNHLGFMADAGKESDDLDVEEDILHALWQPELDCETKVDTSIDEENLSVTLMPLAMLMPMPQAKDAAVPVSSEPTYVDVSDDEQSTVIPTAIQNSNIDQAPGNGVTVVSMGPPAPETITKPARGRGRGRGSKKTTSGQGKANQGGTKGHGAGTSVRAPSDSVATLPKAPGGC